MAPASASRLSRLSAWIGGTPDPRVMDMVIPADGDGNGDGAAPTDLFAQIGAFLDRHALEPTVEHFRIARSFVLRDDDRLVRAIDHRLRDGGAIDAALLASLKPCAQADPLGSRRIAEMADALAARLADTQSTVRQSHASARDYEQALSVEAGTAGSDPDGTIKRLLALTTRAIARNRELADRLEETHRETNLLRSNLEDARRAADEDHLTGLPNRRCFDARLDALSAAAGNLDAHCVALCDIDDFKAINDRHGHDAGDRVLKLVARHLTTELGASVLVARHGGEEFACLFEHCAPDAVLASLDSARAMLGERILVNQATGEGIGRITISGGIARIGDDTAAAMRAADAALYAAKRAGKNRMVFTAPSA
ncbi:GGDEF domain-containing protein [Sphingomonas insulae]|uniref:diguanylate cyclase n=2 Tax=Sphingomonas insulae TaxID=424800 RepID=A0ABP3SZV3_9SPHN